MFKVKLFRIFFKVSATLKKNKLFLKSKILKGKKNERIGKFLQHLFYAPLKNALALNCMSLMFAFIDKLPLALITFAE